MLRPSAPGNQTAAAAAMPSSPAGRTTNKARGHGAQLLGVWSAAPASLLAAREVKRKPPCSSSVSCLTLQGVRGAPCAQAV